MNEVTRTSNEKVPHGEIVYLPKITAEMVIDWNHPVELMKYEGGIQWTQDAVDFACLVAQHAYVEIGRLQTALQSSRDETARACQDYREALAENTKLKRAVSEPPAARDALVGYAGSLEAIARAMRMQAERLARPPAPEHQRMRAIIDDLAVAAWADPEPSVTLDSFLAWMRSELQGYAPSHLTKGESHEV